MKTVKTNGNLEPQSQEEKYSQKNKNKEFSVGENGCSAFK